MSGFNIEDKLKNYKKNRAEVNTTLQRIAVWEDMLKKGDMNKFVNTPSSTLGMPKAPIRQTSSVESIAQESEVTRELVEQWIEDEKSRIFLAKLEVEQIEEAMKALNGKQKFIIESKYFEGWIWRTIERSFNDRYATDGNYITESGLRKINADAIGVLEDILRPFYEQFKIA